jgi:hypothetical protein
MLVPLLLIAWAAIMILCVIVCRMAARGDRALARGAEPSSGFDVPELLPTETAPLTSRGGRGRAARSAAGS